MDRGAWRAIVHGVAKSWTRLNDSIFSNGAYFPQPSGFLESKPQWPSRPDPLGSCFPVQEKLCNEILFQFVDYPWEYRHAS